MWIRTFQDEYDRVFDAKYTVAEISLQTILFKLSNLGIKLNSKLKTKLKNQIEARIDDPTFAIQLDDQSILKINPHLPKDFDFNLVLTSQDINAYMRTLKRKLAEVSQKIAADCSERTYKDTRSKRKETLDRCEKDRLGFEQRLQKFWRVPFETLALLITVATEIGSQFNQEYRPEAVKNSDFVFEALVRIHARGCRTAQVVLSLIRAGYADGAHARWRTLHEMAVIAIFILKHGAATAEQYFPIIG